MSKFQIAVIVLHAASNRLVDLRPLAAGILEAVATALPGRATSVAVTPENAEG